MIRFFEKFGIPRVLLLGFLAVAIFMTGDGFELTFLSNSWSTKASRPRRPPCWSLCTACSRPSAAGAPACSPKCSVPAAS